MWRSININIQNIKRESAKAKLIQMPHNSNYDGFYFWHPFSLIKSGPNSYSLTISYNSDWNFKLVKYGKGKYNSNEIINEMEIDCESFENSLDVSGSNISAPIPKNEYETHKPNKIEPIEQKVLEELKDE